MPAIAPGLSREGPPISTPSSLDGKKSFLGDVVNASRTGGTSRDAPSGEEPKQAGHRFYSLLRGARCRYPARCNTSSGTSLMCSSMQTSALCACDSMNPSSHRRSRVPGVKRVVPTTPAAGASRSASRAHAVGLQSDRERQDCADGSGSGCGRRSDMGVFPFVAVAKVRSSAAYGTACAKDGSQFFGDC